MARKKVIFENGDVKYLTEKEFRIYNSRKIPKFKGNEVEELTKIINSVRRSDNGQPYEVDQPEAIEIDDYEDYEEDDYDGLAGEATEDISFIEFAIINSFLYSAYCGKSKEIKISSFGGVDNVGRLSFGGTFTNTKEWWFNTKFNEDKNTYIIQTKSFIDNRGELVNQLHVTVKKKISNFKIEEILKTIKKLSFNNSEFKGKCVKIKFKEGRFRGIEIIDMSTSDSELILTDVQNKFINHFIDRVGRGSTARYLLNGPPGCGKTVAIRKIINALTPNATFIIPEFSTSDDLTTIMEACEIFDNGVIIIDDIDLYLGSRDNHTNTRMLGEFLSFFDGVKRRKINLLSATNSKRLCDAASSRPGRMSLVLDFSFLNPEQIVKVCGIHLPLEYNIPEIHNILISNINGKKTTVSGAFISCLGENIREMANGSSSWSIEDVKDLIIESYRGFYNSQNSDDNNSSLGFNLNSNR